MRRIEKGSFEYGDGKKYTITKPYYIGVFEVTQSQYKFITGEDPSSSKGELKPVHNLSYEKIRGKMEGLKWPASNSVDKSSPIGRLRARTGIDFDLPTEVQWELACRAGTKSAYNNGKDDEDSMLKLGCCNKGDGGILEPMKVGLFLPNKFGLYDMHGNIHEWVLDRGNGSWADMKWERELKEKDIDPVGAQSGTSRFMRGGSYLTGADGCTSNFRHRVPYGCGNDSFGFRLACPAN